MRVDYRHKITIKQRNSTKNLYGEPIDTWTSVAAVWAGAEPLIGKEYYDAKQNQSDVEIKFRMHYFSGVDAGMRVEYNGKEYDILSVIDYKELNRELILMCKAKVS